MTTKTFALGLVLIAGCLKSNPNYLVDGSGSGSGIDAGSGSGSGSGSGCMSNATCSGTTPVCDTMTGVCGACGSDADCTTGSICLPTGACDDGSDIAFVTATGIDTGACPLAAPCATVGYAVSMTTQAYVVLSGTATDDGVTVARAVTVLGRGSASLTRTATVGAVVTVSAGDVSFYDVEIKNAPGSLTGDGVLSATTGRVVLAHVKVDGNQRYGINATAGTLIARRSEISNNMGGGVLLNAAGFDIENGLIYGNGTGSANFGGVSITSSPNATDTITFTTIASNHATSGVVGGILCSGQTNSLTFDSNIIANNDLDGTLETSGAHCSYTYTDFFPATAFQTGSGNGSGDPMFAGTNDFHIGATSAAIDAADPTATLKIDYYDDPRPHGMYCDMGADEFQ